jgi:hypothetical protein
MANREPPPVTFKDFLRREKHVALNAQPHSFRIAKWIVIIVLAGLLYWWKGLMVVGALILFCIVAGTSLHFLLRWKTNGWTKSWGLYKRIPLDGE